MATTIDYDGAIVFGATDADGVRWRIEKGGFEGWDGSSAPTLDVVQNPRDNWGWAGESFLTPRYMAVRGLIIAPSPILLDGAIDRLNDTVALDDRPFTVTSARGTRWLNVRRADEVRSPKENDWIARYALQVVALDGRKRGTELSASTALPSSSGGLTLPFTVPFAIEATQVAGQVSLTNTGNEVGPVRLRIDGPCTGPVVTHVSSGRSLVFASSLVLTAGEWLDIDMDARTVLANGQANRRMYVTSAGWSGFERGGNTWAFTAAVYNAASLLTVYATPADK
ncbi:phage distal tail protein [Agromyces ramosus]|uniref:Siphovirus-type tail component C-terminal domain-containing protein n=1 Tax=Agromyces ramosus TaxID=33879 RepID=A0ABU0R8M2_9MICO|nr:hypothetical protein [Agromyces ramosus]MDQ0894421.1 hypothetical protein [Agromyces ramosus]